MSKGLRLNMTSEEYQRCERVQALMNDRDTTWYFEFLRKKYVENWQEADDAGVREAMWYQMKALDDLQLLLQSSADVKEAFDSQMPDEEKDES